MANAFNLKAVKRHAHRLDRLVAGWGPCAQLGDHRIVIHADLATFINASVIADRDRTSCCIALPFVVVQQRTSSLLSRWTIAGQTTD